MEVSDLATSAGINIGLAILFLVLYSVFRKLPGNRGVYNTREMLRESQCKEGKKQEEKQPFALENLVPTAGWVKQAWDLSDDDILKSAGLDALVFLRIFVFGMRLFSICTLVGCGILAPLNFNDTYLIDHPSEKNGSLDKLTILNISQGSSRLWFHLAVLYFISITAYTLLYLEYKNITNKRLAYLMAAVPQPDQFSVLVRSIPKPGNEDESYSKEVEDFFQRFHPLHYLSHQMVFPASKLQSFLKEFNKLKDKVVSLKAKSPEERRPCRVGFLGLYGPLVDPIEFYTSKLEDLNLKIRKEQSAIFNRKKELPTAFVSFKTRWEAVVTAQTQQSQNPMLWVTEWAPEPRDVDWGNLEIPYEHHFFRGIVAAIGAGLITIFYIPLTTLVLALANLDSLYKFLPHVLLEILLKIPGVKQVIQGYLPALVLAGILYGLPPVFLFLSKLAGYVSISHQERVAAGKFFHLLAGNVFLVGVLGGSLISVINKFSSEPREIPRYLAESMPSKADFFITYILTTGWAGFPLEILQSGVLAFNFMTRMYVDIHRPLLTGVYSLPYYRQLPHVLLFVMVGLTYSIITPLLLPFLLVYFILGYIVFRNQILHVYEPAYETGGQFWPHVHNRIIFCLVFLQVCFIGVFSVKGLGKGSLLVIPLPILTLLFNAHCRRLFYPNFKQFNVETTVKKDQDDEHNGLREDLWASIRNAYLHPTLQPVELDIHENSNNMESLLPSSSKRASKV